MHRLRQLLFLIVMYSFFHTLHAQITEEATPLWIERWREMLEQGAEEEEANSLFEQLSALQDHPININQATQTDLQRIPFLSEEQIEAILFYQYTHNPIRTLYELKLVEGLDLETVRLITPFLYVGESQTSQSKPFWERYFKVHRSKLSIRSEYNFNPKKGYIATDHGTPPYEGSPFGTQIRYELGNSRHFQTGIAMRKAPGEGLSGGILNPSIHLMVRDIGKVKRAVLGDFRVRFGQGLVVNNCFSLGKNSFTQTQSNSSQGIYRSFSTNPELAFRGAAATVSLGKSEITAFASLKDRDGNVENDTLVSINRSGKYRTQTEQSNRNQSLMYTLGGHYGYHMGAFRIGSTLLWNRFEHPYHPTLRYYNVYQTFGQQSLHASIDYRYHTPQWDVSGESALGQNGSAAFSHLFQVRPSSDWTLRLHHRYYSAGYTNLWSSSLSESSSVNCEQGWLIGLRGDLSAHWNLEGYVDFFSFDRPKSTISAPSKGWDHVLKLSYTPIQEHLFAITYRYKEKSKNHTEELTLEALPLPTYSHRIKGEAHYGNRSTLLFHSYIECSRYHMQGQPPQFGTLFAQQAEWAPMKPPIRFFAAITLFDTNDSGVSFYARDRSSLYSFISPNISGQGARISASIRYRPIPRMTIAMQYGRTEYTHKNEIGSGNELIFSKHKDDLYLTLSYSFHE